MLRLQSTSSCADFSEYKDVVGRLHELVGPLGPDVVVEAVGFHYTKSIFNKVEMALSLETDPAEVMIDDSSCALPYYHVVASAGSARRASFLPM